MAGEDNRTLTQPILTCAKCGGVMELATYLPRFGDRLAYRFFECTTCQALEWKTEMVDASKDA